MPTTVGVVSYRVLVPGVVRFSWHDDQGRGDGLLVDVGVAPSAWHAVADVLLHHDADEPPAETGCFHLVLAEVTSRTDGSFAVDLGNMRVTTADWTTLLAVLVDHYRAGVTRRDLDAGVTRRSGRPPGNA
jgi:hypothetical protein